jgi:hypothetical protein
MIVMEDFVMGGERDLSVEESLGFEPMKKASNPIGFVPFP